jgi:hypothetical protein
MDTKSHQKKNFLIAFGATLYSLLSFLLEMIKVDQPFRLKGFLKVNLKSQEIQKRIF